MMWFMLAVVLALCGCGSVYYVDPDMPVPGGFGGIMGFYEVLGDHDTCFVDDSVECGKLKIRCR